MAMDAREMIGSIHPTGEIVCALLGDVMQWTPMDHFLWRVLHLFHSGYRQCDHICPSSSKGHIEMIPVPAGLRPGLDGLSDSFQATVRNHGRSAAKAVSPAQRLTLRACFAAGPEQSHVRVTVGFVEPPRTKGKPPYRCYMDVDATWPEGEPILDEHFKASFPVYWRLGTPEPVRGDRDTTLYVWIKEGMFSSDYRVKFYVPVTDTRKDLIKKYLLPHCGGINSQATIERQGEDGWLVTARDWINIPDYKAGPEWSI